MRLMLTATSLDLTAASRAYLMEPQWNPTLEEQALARIHRIGQKRPVTTARFVMQDSLEEVDKTRSYEHQRPLTQSQQIVELQNKKKFLVELMLSETKPSAEQSNHARLQQLRSLLR